MEILPSLPLAVYGTTAEEEPGTFLGSVIATLVWDLKSGQVG